MLLISRGMRHTPPKSLLRPVGRTLVRYRMLREGDRLLAAISGGKDSLSMLQILLHFQAHAPIRFELGAVTIDPLIPSFDPSPLIDYMAELGIPYYFCREPIMDLAQQHMGKDSYCAFCARMKRGLIYKVAREENYGVIALGQHLDDLAESFLMSAFYQGRLETMKVNYTNDAGDLRIIRPLVDVRERQLRDFAAAANLPVIQDNCPACFTRPTEREHMKQLLAAEETHNPRLFKSLARTLEPLRERGWDQPSDKNSD